MTWVQNHPPGTTSVASTKTQFQQNFLYLENTAQNDHYFDDADPANDGHHRVVNLGLQAVDPPLGIADGANVFVKDGVSASAVPYFQNDMAMFKIPLALTLGTIVTIAGVTTVIDMAVAGMPAMTGWIYAYRPVEPQKAMSSTFMWNGANVYTNYLNGGDGLLNGDTAGRLVEFTSIGTALGVRTTIATTVNVTMLCVLTS